MKEALRLIKIREGDKVLTIPAIQAVLRSQINNAAKGNNRAQQNVIDIVQSIARQLIAQAELEEAERAKRSEIDDIDLARRIAFLLDRAKRAQEKKDE